MTEDVAAPGDVQCTDPDPGDTLTYAVVAQPAKGSVVMATDGTFTYTPDPNKNGADSFTYRALDSSSTPSNTATVTVTIAAVDDPPSFTAGPDVTAAEDAGAQTRAGWATAISVGPADEAVTQHPVFSITADSDPTLFSVLPAVSPTGTLTFTSKANANGAATITVALSDGTSTVEATFSITVTPANDPPNAVNDVGVLVPALGGAAAIPVLTNDVTADVGETLTISAVTQGAKGKVAITGSGTGLTYAPSGCNIGSDTFTYTISDGNGGHDTATVLLTITRDTVKPVAVPPAASFTVGSILGSTTLPIHLSWCATDPGSGVARYTLAQSTDAKTFATVALSPVNARAVSRNLTAGHHYQFRVRGTDGDGSIGAYATGPTMTALRYQETTTTIVYTGTWKATSSSTASSGKVKYTTAKNATATFTFSGRAVALVAPTSSSRGTVKVYIDGVYISTATEKTVGSIARRLVFARTLSAGSHTIKLVVVGNGRVDLDAIVVLS